MAAVLGLTDKNPQKGCEEKIILEILHWIKKPFDVLINMIYGDMAKNWNFQNGRRLKCPKTTKIKIFLWVDKIFEKFHCT